MIRQQSSPTARNLTPAPFSDPATTKAVTPSARTCDHAAQEEQMTNYHAIAQSGHRPVKMPDFDILAEGKTLSRRGRAPDEPVTDRQPGI